MSNYIFIQSRDPFDSREPERIYEVAKGLKQEGHDVTVFLVQNGVLPARNDSAYAKSLQELSQSKINLLADSFSLKERAILKDELIPEVRDAVVDELVELLLQDGAKPIWN